MPQQQTVWWQAETPSAPGDGRRAVTAQHEARQNHLLAALPLDDFERLLPDLEPVPLPLGWTMHGAGEPEKYLYFITAGVVAKFLVLQNGASAEVAVAGREGVIGLALFLASGIATTQAVVVSPGYAYRLKAGLVKDECRHSGPLPGLMLRYSQALMEQIAQIAVCNRHHSLQQRLCLWMLLCLDRLPSSELTMTQELIAEMLGVRREGVTEAAGKLQDEGLIHYRRGHITVSDRCRLEAQACECYAVVKREYRRLIPASS